MLLATDLSATFYPSTIQGSRSLGYGQLNVGGIVINFTVYPSQYGQGFYVSFPSRPAMKNGVQEIDERGQKKYVNEVYISEQSVRPLVDDAVLQAMQNKGLTVPTPTPQTNNRSFAPPVQEAARSFVNSTPSPSPTYGSSVVTGDDLPF